MLVPVVIAFTPNYFVPAATTLKSILDSSSTEARFEIICLVSEDIPQRQKDILSRMAEGRMAFRYVNLAGSLGEAYVDPRYSEAASYRLLLPEILQEFDKILYIDCDVIVRNDLSALFDSVQLDDKLLAAVYEAPIGNQAERWAAIGCDPEHYFNSGMLIMNLEQMRKEGTSAIFMKELHADYLEFPDQDVLNKVCRGRVLALSPKYNSIRTFFLPQYKNEFVRTYSSSEWDAVQKTGTIHYTGGKPWRLFTVKFGEWWRTYDTLPAEARAEWTPDTRTESLWHIYRVSVCRLAIDAVQWIYRKVKH